MSQIKIMTPTYEEEQLAEYLKMNSLMPDHLHLLTTITTITTTNNRTGRIREGEVTILLTAGTRDEAYRWSAHHNPNGLRWNWFEEVNGNRNGRRRRREKCIS